MRRLCAGCRAALALGGMAMTAAAAANAATAPAFTRIRGDGRELAPSARTAPGSRSFQWACTRDNRSGLTWEIKTDDRGLRDLCRGMGALTMDADSFIRTVREFQGGVKEEIGRTARAASKPALLEDRLSGDSARLLEEMRARLDQKKRGPSS